MGWVSWLHSSFCGISILHLQAMLKACFLFVCFFVEFPLLFSYGSGQQFLELLRYPIAIVLNKVSTLGGEGVGLGFCQRFPTCVLQAL